MAQQLQFFSGLRKITFQQTAAKTFQWSLLSKHQERECDCSGQFLSVAGSKQTDNYLNVLGFFVSKLFTTTKSSAEATVKGWINQGGSTWEKNMHPSKWSIYFLCVFQIDTCSSSYSSLESWSMTFFFCFPNAKQRYPFLIFAVIINSICFMLARPMKQKILHNVFFQQLHKGNMHIGRDYLIVISCFSGRAT